MHVTNCWCPIQKGDVSSGDSAIEPLIYRIFGGDLLGLAVVGPGSESIGTSLRLHDVNGEHEICRRVSPMEMGHGSISRLRCRISNATH